MPDIAFTQYLRPDGRRETVNIDRPDDIATRAQAIMDRGLRFECEVLTTGQVSLTVFDPDEEIDIDIEVVANGPEVLTAVDRLVERNFSTMPCPDCEGAGEWDEGPINCGGPAPVDPEYRQVICERCEGKGRVPIEPPASTVPPQSDGDDIAF